MSSKGMIATDRKLPPALWWTEPSTRAVLDAVEAGGGRARFVGGSVRNALLGGEVQDVDIATDVAPDEVQRRIEAKGLRAVPTGIEHGTVTAISAGRPYEITTLRKDVSTDGRRATVAYTDDWAEDAARRDFTMNALYADRDGTIYDPTGGLDDLAAGRVRFIGDADRRIAEDYLRILRLFRFHAWYGKGDIDREALAAVVRGKGGLAGLSGERISKEMLRLLEADEPVPVLRQMAATGIISEVLPGALDMERFAAVVAIESGHLFTCDPVLRLGALLDGGAAQRDDVAKRWRLANKDRDRLAAMHGEETKIVSFLSIREVRRALYRLTPPVFKDRVMLRWARDPKTSNAPQWRALLALADSWERPAFPMTGHEVMAAGVPPGPKVGQIMQEVEDWWVDSDFTDDKFSLIERLKAVVQATIY